MTATAQPRGLPRARELALLVLAASPSIVFGVASSDEIAGDNFEGFALTPCDGALASDSSVAADYAAALDLCATTTEGSHAPGLISASLALTDSVGFPPWSKNRS